MMRTLLLSTVFAVAAFEAHAASCALPKYPTLDCVGVPAGTSLQTVNGDAILNTAGQVYEAKKVSGAIVVKADNVTIKRTQVGLFITQEGSPKNLVVEDTTIGPTAANCQSTKTGSGGVGLGWQNFSARRVLIRGNVDGVRIAGSNVLVEDSYIETCSKNAEDHGDGVQAYGAQGAKNIKLIHNTWDQRPSMATGGYTAPIWLPNDRTEQLNTGVEWTAVNDNLLIGGTMSLRMPGNPGDTIAWTAKSVSGNKVVDKSWYYGPTEIGPCRHFEAWNNNAVVKYDYSTGTILSQVKLLTDCPESGSGTTPPDPEPPAGEPVHVKLNILSDKPLIVDDVTVTVP